ncbi:MAG: hypothetical protein M3540_11650 [Actinomycetota bacterium]|nr:hypothetical protein [Actinomycetota bacterium]
MPDRRRSKKQVLLAVAVGFVVLFGTGVAFEAASRDTNAVTFHGGDYVDPVPLTRAQIEYQYGAFVPAGSARIDGRRVFVPTKQRDAVRPDVLFVLEPNGRNAVLYGLSK